MTTRDGLPDRHPGSGLPARVTIWEVGARDGRAVMAVWSDRPATERVFLGDEVEQIDVWGRGTKPESDRQDGRPVHGDDLRLRFRYYYNPAKGELGG